MSMDQPIDEERLADPIGFGLSRAIDGCGVRGYLIDVLQHHPVPMHNIETAVDEALLELPSYIIRKLPLEAERR